MSSRIETVAVVGRDAPAWIAAAAIQRSFGRSGVQVRVIELPTALQPVDAYAAVPSLSGMHQQLGIDERLIFRVCGAVPMVGRRFSNWSGAGAPFIHGYDDEPPPGTGVDFTQVWIKGSLQGLRSGFENFSLGAMAAKAGRVPVRADASEETLTATYGYHLDAGRYSGLMREVAIRSGVAVHDAPGADVEVEGDRVHAVVLSSGERVTADLFVDASGAQAALIGRMRGGRFTSWREQFPCDRMLAVSAKGLVQPPAFSQISAFRDGWFGLFPLQDRTAVVAVYDSKRTGDGQVIESLPVLARLPIAGDAVVSELHQGVRDCAWVGNCVAVGEAAFSLEPLDALQLHITHSCVSHLMTYFPVERDSFPESAAYNRAVACAAANMRDFQLAHYKLNRRFDDPLWDRCRDAECPSSLQARIDLFAARGEVVLYDNETFGAHNWASIFLGHGLMPDSYDPRVDLIPEQEHIARVHQRLQDIVTLVGRMPSVEELLADQLPHFAPEVVQGV